MSWGQHGTSGEPDRTMIHHWVRRPDCRRCRARGPIAPLNLQPKPPDCLVRIPASLSGAGSGLVIVLLSAFAITAPTDPAERAVFEQNYDPLEATSSTSISSSTDPDPTGRQGLCRSPARRRPRYDPSSARQHEGAELVLQQSAEDETS